MYSNYKPSSSIPNTTNRWGQPQQHQATTNVNNTDLSNILSLVGGVQRHPSHQPTQQPSEIDNLKQSSNPNYVHPDAQHADAVLRAKAIAAQMKAKQIAAGFHGYPPVVHHANNLNNSTSYSSLADNNTPVINNNIDMSNTSTTATMNTANSSWSLPDSLPPTLNTLDNRYKAPPSSHSLLPPTQAQAIAAANNNFSYKPANIATQQQQHIDELRMLNMDQPMLPPASQKLGKFHPLKDPIIKAERFFEKAALRS